MAFKKGQSVIVAKFEKGNLTNHAPAIVEKGGKEYFYVDRNKFIQASGRMDWEPNGRMTYVFESVDAMNYHIERIGLLSSIRSFFDYGYNSKIATLNNSQLKGILDIINQ